MSFIRMSFTEVDQIATSLTTSAQQHLADLNALAQKANPEAVWEGTAAQSYKDAFDRWSKAQQAEQQALEALARAVNTVKNNFQQINESGGAAFSQFYQ